MEQPVTEELAGSFFVFDQLIESETADPAECALFFHPASTAPNLQGFLLGYVSAMAVFLEGFGGSLRIIRLHRSKMAVKKIEGLTVVLVGRHYEADESVRAHLDDIYEAFCFFYGSFGAVLEAHVDAPRKELLKAFRRIGEELLPLVDNYHSSPLSSFDPLPVALLPAFHSRVMVAASQLLVATQPRHLGGVVLLHHAAPGALAGIVASQLPVNATRWVSCRVTHVGDSFSALEGTAMQVSAHCDVLTVLLPHILLAELREEAQRREPLIEPDDDNDEAFDDVHVRDGRSSLAPQDEADFGEPPEGMERAGLLVVYVGRLAVAVLTELPSLLRPRPLQRLRGLCERRLSSLASNFRVLGFAAPPGAPISHSSESADMEASLSPGTLPSLPMSPIPAHASLDVSLSTPTTLASGGRRRIESLASSSSLSQFSGPAHWLFMQDRVTGSSTQSTRAPPTANPNAATELLNVANMVHDMFARSPSVHQLSLRAQDRSIFCKRLGSKEIYLMQQPAPTSTFDIHAEAKRILQSEYGVRIM